MLLAATVALVNFMQSFFLPSGGVYADGLSYFEIASDLPDPVTNLFPLGYPVMLRMFYEIFGDYFWAFKFLNLFMIVAILLFSYFKRFYFKETVLLLAGKTFLTIFSVAISESVFLFLLYFLWYYLYKIVTETSTPYKNIIATSVLIVAMFVVRYSGIYIYLGIVLFSILFFFRFREKGNFKNLMVVILLSGLGIAGYLLFNLKVFGSFTGEDLRGDPYEILPVDVLRNLLGTVNAVNPFFGLKPASNSFASLAFQFLEMAADILIFIFAFRYFKKAGNTQAYPFHLMLWTVSIIYAVSLLVSGWFQQIEEMNTRMMAATNVCLFFSFLMLYFKNHSSDKLIFRTTCFFLFFTVAYAVKNPENYFKNRKQIEIQKPEFTGKKYIYNDEKEEMKVTTYYIPVLKKTFQYRHTNNQQGSTKQYITGTINPKIKWLKNDTVKNKSKVLYTSGLVLKTE